MAKDFEFTIPHPDGGLPMAYLITAKTLKGAQTQLRAELDADDPHLCATIDVESLKYEINS